jgi:hypothetical protein
VIDRIIVIDPEEASVRDLKKFVSLLLIILIVFINIECFAKVFIDQEIYIGCHGRRVTLGAATTTS